MMKHLICLSVLLLIYLHCRAQEEQGATPRWLVNFRLGYSVGGTAPIGMPATIRSLDSYRLQPNFGIGVDLERRQRGCWGIMGGLHLLSKGMDVNATVKNYQMVMTKGGDEIEGAYTGRLVTQVEQLMFQLPVQAVYHTSEKFSLRAGTYLSWLPHRSFKGYAYDGYLRYINPTGERIELGNSADTRGTYDFSEHMRQLQWGVMAGADWKFGTHWGAYADVQWGLTGVHKSSFTTIRQTLYPIYGTIGFFFSITNK